MIPASHLFDQSTMAALLEHDPVVADYRAFFALLDWSLVEQWQAQHSARGRPAHPESAYLKAFLVRIREGLIYTSQLRRFLLKHPLLVIELGFHLELDPTAPYGFDCQKTLPSDVRLRQKLRPLDHLLLQDLLAATVTALQEAIPGLGETVAFDVKHIFAWVRENNPNVYVKGRFDVTRISKGDPDCRLGVKKSSNQEQPDGSKKKKRSASLAMAPGSPPITNPVYGDVVLAEYTQPFNEGDVTSFFARSTDKLCSPWRCAPTHVTADAAFDAWYVYQCAALHDGIGAVPLNQHAHPLYERATDGTPICPKGLPMQAAFSFNHTNGYRALRSQSPALSSGHRCVLRS